ncbi:MAG: glycosyltransferase family protein [Spirochaetes bacterium]|nr:glycosyltransferase family protein [Spirochaetota bacterium]
MKKKQSHTITAIIQARMQSSRLPAKSVLPLAGKPLLYHVITRAQAIKHISTVVVAIPDDEDNDELADIATSCNAHVFRGPLHNVLERYYLAFKQYNGSYVVRITADNPFTDSHFASVAIERALDTHAHLCAIKNLPLGTGVEVIASQALEEAYLYSTKPYHFEHVTPYIKENPDKYTLDYFEVDYYNPFPSLRLTVDTQQDYLLASTIYDALYKGTVFSLNDVIAFLEKNPHLVEINAHIQQKPMTSHE